MNWCIINSIQFSLCDSSCVYFMFPRKWLHISLSRGHNHYVMTLEIRVHRKTCVHIPLNTFKSPALRFVPSNYFIILTNFCQSFSLGPLIIIENTAAVWWISDLAILVTNIALATKVCNSSVSFLPSFLLRHFQIVYYHPELILYQSYLVSLGNH